MILFLTPDSYLLACVPSRCLSWQIRFRPFTAWGVRNDLRKFVVEDRPEIVCGGGRVTVGREGRTRRTHPSYPNTFTQTHPHIHTTTHPLTPYATPSPEYSSESRTVGFLAMYEGNREGGELGIYLQGAQWLQREQTPPTSTTCQPPSPPTCPAYAGQVDRLFARLDTTRAYSLGYLRETARRRVHTHRSTASEQGRGEIVIDAQCNLLSHPIHCDIVTWPKRESRRPRLRCDDRWSEAIRAQIYVLHLTSKV